jgi:hypothetical protein
VSNKMMIAKIVMITPLLLDVGGDDDVEDDD